MINWHVTLIVGVIFTIVPYFSSRGDDGLSWVGLAITIVSLYHIAL